ncbi:MAG: hypothetical protein WAN86_02575 [Hyphomicrobiaceae bacterium]
MIISDGAGQFDVGEHALYKESLEVSRFWVVGPFDFQQAAGWQVPHDSNKKRVRLLELIGYLLIIIKIITPRIREGVPSHAS